MERRQTTGAIVLFVLAVVGLVAGWWTYWFLCDDAYIAFRYVSNSVLGHGYVWNAPPFRPVEGYSSFLWVVMLDVVWRLFGVEPPASSNPMLLLFAIGSLAVTTRMVWELRLSPHLARARLPLLALVLFSVVSNRTFLAWSSSGLETAMFVFWLLLWVFVAVFRPMTRGWLTVLVALAAILELARPDGMLFLLATGCSGLLFLNARRRAGTLVAADLLPTLPLVVTFGHLLWRFNLYGAWVTNTAYAKHTAPWPSMGINYVAGFALEYAYWVWGLLLLLGLVRIVGQRATARTFLASVDEAWLYQAIGVTAIVGHWAYYTLRIGGDHFEFRVYTQLVPLIAVSMPWLLDKLGWSARRSLTAFALMTALGLPIPWVHWYHTHDITVRFDKGMPRYKIAKHFPSFIAWYPRAWDALQDVTIRHWVGMRQQTHRMFLMQYQWKEYPSREQGLAYGPEGLPVMLTSAVGYPGWVLPHVAMIDMLGLNDAVIARNPIQPLNKQGKPKSRRMAHERVAPKGYAACFQANVTVNRKGEVTVRERATPLTAEQVVDCETRFFDLVMASHGQGVAGDDD